MLLRNKPTILLLSWVLCVFFVFTTAASANDEIHAAQIREALNAVVQAAKEFQLKTGKEAASLDDLTAANLLMIKDLRLVYMVNDMWHVWGDKTGSLIMWEENVSPSVCKLFNEDGKLPTDSSGMPIKSRGLQCITYLNEFRVLEPVYIHGE